MASQTVTGSGIFRSSLLFLRRHFWEIIAISAAPMLLELLLIAGSAWLEAHQHAGPLGHRQTLPARSLLPNEFAIPLSYLVVLWISVRIYRYRLGFSFQVAQGEAASYGWSLIYSLLLTFIFALASLILASSTAGFATGGLYLMSLASHHTYPDPRLAAIALAAIAMSAGSAIWVLYMAVRLAIGLPGVAIGERPSIVDRMWPMGRNVAWPLTGCWLLLVADAVIATRLLAFAAGTLPEWIANLAVAVPDLLFRIASAVLFAEAYVQLNRSAKPAFVTVPSGGLAERSQRASQ